ncbi:hypothetical protein VTK73DRAFT_6592 [Phialemonium thermophilum]|uniref:Peptidase A1 domain-containing protein n=1 Tax=Phialemonium thermophilum TaxID=223376 RepID=A0ABR3WJ98_9PEZI
MTTWPLLLLTLVAGLSASVSLARNPYEGRFVSYPIRHGTRNAQLFRRDAEVTLHNQSVLTYLLELDIGTPPQRVEVVLDTGSFELWVDPQCSTASTTAQSASCKEAGLYDPYSSSTVQDMGVVNELPYGKGVVDIAYVADSVQVPGSSTMKEVVFGVGLESRDLGYGIAGVGHGKGYNIDYNNLIDELYAQGLTDSKAFSLALGSIDASDGGSIVFGGVDTKKFSGPLVRFRNLPPQDEGGGVAGPYRYWVQLDAIGVTKPGKRPSKYADSALPIVLDSGSTMSYLPRSVINQLMADLAGQTDSDGNIRVPCSTAATASQGGGGGTVDFTLGALTVHVPFHEFVWQLAPDECYVLAAAPLQAGTAILGDSFLRSAYAVFDQTNGDIYLAPYANCGSRERALPAGPGAAANFTGECSVGSGAGGGHGKGSAPSGRSVGMAGVAAGAAVALGLPALFFGLA